MADGHTTIDTIRARLVERGIRVELNRGGDEALDVAVSGATHDSRDVRPGQIFVCLRGDSFDGHRFASQAVADGATALLVDHLLPDLDDTPQLVVSDTRIAAGPVSAAAWGDPSDRLVTVGITGTNGKTTTAQIVATMLDAAGLATGIVGTLHGPRTTPEAPDLQATLAGFVGDERGGAVMEVSSHALTLHRVDGTRFDIVAFTNFGHDHLDLHGTPENYFRAKSTLFTSGFAPVAIINVDDPHGRLLADIADMRVVEVSERDLVDVVVGSASHSYTWRSRTVTVAIGGDFNVVNSLMALSIVAEIATGSEIDLDAAIAGLASLAPVPGRFEIVDSPTAIERGIDVVVDYAHTPDGLERLLEAAREIVDGRVIAVFGCAGRRDREKRPAMGEIAGRLADIAIATSDNPRGEDPDAIIAEVIGGVGALHRSRVTAQPDRRLAIREALQTAQPGDIVVIAGKGHERTQDLGDDVIDFDDRLVAMTELEALRP